MLYHSNNYLEELRRKLTLIMHDPKYRYVNYNYSNIKVEYLDTDWENHSFVSVDPIRDDVIGYFTTTINRSIYSISSMEMLNFGEPSIVFVADLMRFFKFLCEQKFNKICWGVVVGNPVEAQYDRFAKRIGARIVGIKYNEVIIAGEFYHWKMYEYLRR